MESLSWSRASLNKSIQSAHSCLCVGLDTDRAKIPSSFQSDINGIFKFNKAIIDVTLPYVVCYKINAAFYEVYGPSGWSMMEDTIEYIRSKNKFIILDAKRGDIGNTGKMYASACFDALKADAMTVSPYMGKDSVDPFLGFKDKWTILLVLTSNEGAQDFQLQKMATGQFLFEKVLQTASEWADHNQLMFVIGATNAEYLQLVRNIVPDYFLLIPGIGAQGGDLRATIKSAKTKDGDILINASRSILYASDGTDFALAAEKEARDIQKIMAEFI